jgi:two-component system nitrate/nitrite response regulator NarL
MIINKIYIADTEKLFVDCLSTNLSLQGKFEILGVSSNGIEAYNEIKILKPDLVITEVSLQTLSGINLIRKIKATGLQTKLILLSTEISPAVIHRVLSAGVDGIILKSDPYSRLLEAISVIHQRKFLSPGISEPLVNNFLGLNSTSSDHRTSPLSDREEQVAKLIGDGVSSKEIAEILSISEKTVSKHRSNIFKKLDIKNTAQLVRYVLDHDLVG